MKRLSISASILLLLALFIAGCSGPVLAVQGSSEDVPTATAARPAQPAAQPAAEQGAPAEPAGKSVDFNGISFAFSPSLAKGVETAIVPEALPSPEGGPWWAVNPEFAQIKFTGYVLDKTFHEPRIVVYPVSSFRAMNPAAAQEIDALQSYLKDGSLSEGRMPFLPLFNAAQVFHASAKKVDFKNGSGVRYITQFDQAPLPIKNGDMFYAYQGLTKDGAYYVSAILPLSNKIIPEGEKTSIEGDFMEYVAASAKELEAQLASSYSPDLATLDALVASISVSSK